MATRNPANKLRMVIEIPLFMTGFIHSNGGWPWDFWSINSIFWQVHTLLAWLMVVLIGKWHAKQQRHGEKKHLARATSFGSKRAPLGGSQPSATREIDLHPLVDFEKLVWFLPTGPAGVQTDPARWGERKHTSHRGANWSWRSWRMGERVYVPGVLWRFVWVWKKNLQMLVEYLCNTLLTNAQIWPNMGFWKRPF